MANVTVINAHGVGTIVLIMPHTRVWRLPRMTPHVSSIDPRMTRGCVSSVHLTHAHWAFSSRAHAQKKPTHNSSSTSSRALYYRVAPKETHYLVLIGKCFRPHLPHPAWCSVCCAFARSFPHAIVNDQNLSTLQYGLSFILSFGVSRPLNSRSA